MRPKIRRESDPVGHIEVHVIEQIEDLPPQLDPDVRSTAEIRLSTSFISSGR